MKVSFSGAGALREYAWTFLTKFYIPTASISVPCILHTFISIKLKNLI